MGYRSDVSLCIYGCREKMLAFVAAQRIARPNDYAIWKDEIQITKFDDKVMMRADFNHVKWYDSYDDVKCYRNLLDAAGQDDDICYEFVRIGEEYEDNETEFHGDDVQFFISIHREITYDYPNMEDYNNGGYTSDGVSSGAP